ncbi:G2/mitotic-specific cyclin-B-like [Coccinella septempunctata]|uniref:G2/mitotic-specific cyclin-B-like n=1 Tax=Coccinella septempunctata TaxID=41139 RepID=UPI001D097F8C|nr:G2/mitotic-specific cyclin-B-like [Coccinella septempunctata]XP_044744888.1 G2/mitotic-specific cyclin-B-like [Coccinella septempunctata]
MESRRIGLSLRTDQHRENVIVGKKIDNAQPRFPKSRPALRDLSNKIGTQIPKDGPQKNLVKFQKPLATAAPVDIAKDNISKLKISSGKVETNTTKRKPVLLLKPLKKQDSIIDKTSAYSAKQLVIYDPDENSKNDPCAVTEYVEDIFSYLREMEVKYAVEKDHLQDHKTTSSMRATLVNWLIELQVSFKLNVETSYMCVSLLDRYLQLNKDIGRETLQLVGVSALMIASKYEEIYIPEIGDFVYVCDDSFSARQILAMERDILATLKFSLGKPTAIHFLRRYSKVARASQLQHCLAKYMLELALIDYQMCHILPSHQAAAACCLAIAILTEEMDLSKVWSPTLVHYTTYKLSDFKHVIRKFAVLLDKEDKSKYRAVSEKYAQASNHKISTNPKLKGRLITKLLLEKN